VFNQKFLYKVMYVTYSVLTAFFSPLFFLAFAQRVSSRTSNILTKIDFLNFFFTCEIWSGSGILKDLLVII